MDSSDEKVCSLPEAELPDRVTRVRQEILPHVVRREKLANGIAWEFENEPALRARLEEFVEFERGCCGGLQFDLQELPDSGALRITVEGPGAAAFEALAGD